MDNVTHTLFALTLARTPLGRGGRRTAALVLASNAPDIDIVAAVGGASSYLRWHRGPTHGPLGVIGLALMTTALVWAGSWAWRRIRLKPDLHARKIRLEPDPPYGGVFVAAAVGVLAHILMDLPTSYGTRFLSPFSWRWFAIDLLPIIDVYLLVVLAAGLIVGSASVRHRQKSVAIVLALMAANYGVRAIAHRDAIARTERVFGHALPPPCDADAAAHRPLASWPRPHPPRPAGNGPCRQEVAAIPTFGSPFRWRVLAQVTDAYYEYDINVFHRELRDGAAAVATAPHAAVRVPNEWTPLVREAAETTPAVQTLLGFSRFPAVRTVAGPGGSATVLFTDMRFTDAPLSRQLQGRRSSLFTVAVTREAERSR
jgi:membrane-bound metal-dependent hydrolase YbcI (DUF457 family)